jgi:hypothetical protein
MTVIAAFQSNDTPVLIGDMAISANDIRTTLRKKIYWVGPNLVIGWSGSLFVATKILKSILDRFNERSVSKAEFEKFLETYRPITSGELQAVFIGWIMEEEPHCFLWRTDYPTQVFYDHSYSVGSGGKYFEDVMKPPVEAKGEIPDDFKDEGNVVRSNAALHETLVHTGQMFFSELMHPKEWDQTFGFAYDILLFWQGEFRYVNRISHLAWDYYWDDARKTGRLEQSPLIVKYINCGHFSVIQGVKHKDLKVVEQTNYVSMPLYDDFPDLDLSNMGFSIFADYYSSYFLFHSKGKCVLQVPYITGNVKPRLDVWVEGNDENPIIGVNTKFLDEMYLRYFG